MVEEPPPAYRPRQGVKTLPKRVSLSRCLPIMYMALMADPTMGPRLGRWQTLRIKMHPTFLPWSVKWETNLLLSASGAPKVTPRWVIMGLTFRRRSRVKSMLMEERNLRWARLTQRRQPVPPMTFRRLYLQLWIPTPSLKTHPLTRAKPTHPYKDSEPPSHPWDTKENALATHVVFP